MERFEIEAITAENFDIVLSERVRLELDNK